MRTTPSYGEKCSRVNGKHLSTGSATCDPRDLIPRILESPAAWRTVVDFAEVIIEIKEETDRGE